MSKKPILIQASIFFTLLLAGCADELPAGGTTSGDSAQKPTEAATATTASTGGTTSGATMGGTTVASTTGGTTTTTGGTTSSGTTVSASGGSVDEVTVGGFSVETPNAPGTKVPDVTVSRQAAKQFLDEVQPIIEESTQDFSTLAEPEVGLQNGNLTLDVPLDSLENARGKVRDGLDQLQQIDPPQSLQPINEQLIKSFERVLPAYTDTIKTAKSGDTDRLSDEVQKNLPRIEHFDSEASAILQDLERAAGTQ
ncbi:hypothetical protein BH23ACT11_BH23ACT11_11760 [soil metagenome]